MTRTNRRDFLKTAAATSLGIAGLPLLDPNRIIGANARLNLGVIAVAGRGGANLNGVSSQNIVALCDIDTRRLAGAAKRFKDAKTYVDFRELLEQKDLDGVTISTPDHTHAPATVRAIRRGLNVYCEKPLTHTIEEARLIRKLTREHGVATQMGTQNHAREGYLRTIEHVRAGTIGEVKEVHVITDRPGGWWPQGIERPTKTPKVPKHINWNLWLGAAPERPYSPAYVHFKWRGWWDFGCGAVGDMAIHLMDCAFWGLELGGPVKVSSTGSEVLSETGPTWMKTRFEFGPRGKWGPVNVFWYEGKAKADADIAKDLPMNGCLFVGTEGRIAVVHGQNHCKVITPDGTTRSEPKKSLPRSIGHHKEWIRACQEGTPTGSNFDYACQFTEVVLLSNISFRTGKSVHWDPIAGRVTNNADANKMVSKAYRDGWKI